MNWWQFVSGGAEFGESLAESALREVQEEIGISFSNNELMHLDTCCSVPKNILRIMINGMIYMLYLNIHLQ
ncbi:NUDIX domain-containing protein [Bacillus toyonensis]